MNKKIQILSTIGLIWSLGNGSAVGVPEDDITVTVKAIEYKTSDSYDNFDIKALKGYNNSQAWSAKDVPGTKSPSKNFMNH